MRLNIRDNHNINAIIANLTNEDHESIRKEVERLTSLKRPDPLARVVGDYEPSQFTGQACDWLTMSDVDFQVRLSEMLWDLLTDRVTREYAISLYLTSLEGVA